MSAPCPAPHIAHRSGPRPERLRLARASPIADLQRTSLANELWPTPKADSSPNNPGCSLGDLAHQRVSIAFVSGELGLVSLDHESAAGVPGGLIQRTANGGQTWQTVYVTDHLSIHQVTWTSADTAVAATASGLLVTRNQGASWTLVPGLPVCSVQAPSPGTAYAVTSAGLYSISEPSMRLTRVATPLPVAGVHFVNRKLGWLAGPSGIAMTANGGGTWHIQLRFKHPFYQGWDASLATESGSHLVATYAGGTVSGNPAIDIYGSANGGHSWTLEEGGGYVPVPTGQVPVGGVDQAGATDGQVVAIAPNRTLLLGTTEESKPSTQASAPSLCETSNVGRNWICRRFPFLDWQNATFDAGYDGEISAVRSQWWLAVVDGDQLVIASGAHQGADWQVVERIPLSQRPQLSR